LNNLSIFFYQSKQIEKSLRQKLSRIVLALYDRDEVSIALALLDVGLVFESAKTAPISLSTVAKAAYILFDVCLLEEATVSPMSENSILKEIPLKQLNQALWMVSR
jgi:aarF domain-containing kinase